jgi:serine/threonine protein kinase
MTAHNTNAGHESLCNAGILHRDISEGNIMLDMDPKNPKGWLIDLEMAVK